MQGMRYFICAICWIASANVWGQTPHGQIALSTGATSYVGASDGPSSAGVFLTTLAARWDLTPHLRAEAGVHSGGFGLTSSAFNRYQEAINGGQGALILHPNWSRTWRINPHLAFGISRFRHTVSADLHNAAGETYYVWSDGALYDMAEDAPYAQLQAQTMLPDFQPDAEVARGMTWGIPLRLGMDWQVSDQWTLEASQTWQLGAAPLLNPLTGDAPSLTAFSIGVGWRPGSRMFCDDRIPEAYLSKRTDTDGDGVRDSHDACFNTPVGIDVDAKGCPTDADGDGVPDFMDAQPGSIGLVDSRGVEVDWEHLSQPVQAMPNVDYRQVIADPETGTRPHLPLAPTSRPKRGTQPFENP